MQRQYSGTAGRIENCQIGVFLAYASPKGHALIDRELYLPKSWTQDSERCRDAHVPDDMTFATKPAIALRLLQRTWDAGISVAWVTGDTVYGGNSHLRAELETRQQAYALAISCQERVDVSGKRVRVDDLIQEAAQEEWCRLCAGNGTKGPRLHDWIRMELDNPEVDGWRRWLVVRRSIASSGGEPPDRAFFLVFARAGTPFSEMIQAVGGRWSSEQCFEIGKSEVGLDDYEIRSWHGWYRHITLCLLAIAFLMILQLRGGENELADDEEKAEHAEEQVHPLPSASQQPLQPKRALPMMVPLSIPELRRLFYTLVGKASFSFLYHLTWSDWRRTHQAIARLWHYKHRMIAYLQL